MPISSSKKKKKKERKKFADYRGREEFQLVTVVNPLQGSDAEIFNNNCAEYFDT